MIFDLKPVVRACITTLLCLYTLVVTPAAQAQTTSGYTLVQTTTDQTAADKKKNEILQISNDLFAAGTFTGDNQEHIGYRVLSPLPAAGIRKYPLILIFHNSGRIGTDNTAQLDLLVKFWGQPHIRRRYPAYVIAVQFPVRSSNYTTRSGDLMSSDPAPCLQAALQLTDSLKKVLPVDHSRIYTLGFSMGASTVNNALMARPELFAAGLCISGIPTLEKAELLKRIPIWIIHGNKDTDNPIAGDKAFYTIMQGQKKSAITFWEIAGLEHKIYSPLYTTDIMPQWLFAQKKKSGTQQR